MQCQSYDKFSKLIFLIDDFMWMNDLTIFETVGIVLFCIISWSYIFRPYMPIRCQDMWDKDNQNNYKGSINKMLLYMVIVDPVVLIARLLDSISIHSKTYKIYAGVLVCLLKIADVKYQIV